jgi:uncharacterized protein YcgI (DUF1989 family)
MITANIRQRRAVHSTPIRAATRRAQSLDGRKPMSKILGAMLATGLLFSVAGTAYAAAPKTKAACEKVKTMAWDETTKKCMKK